MSGIDSIDDVADSPQSRSAAGHACGRTLTIYNAAKHHHETPFRPSRIANEPSAYDRCRLVDARTGDVGMRAQSQPPVATGALEDDEHRRQQLSVAGCDRYRLLCTASASQSQ